MAKLSSTASHSLGKENARSREALSGDIIFTITPTITGSTEAVADAGTPRTVTVSLTNAAGDVHEWFNRTITSGVATSNTAGSGASTIVPAADLVFVNGTASVVLTPTGDYAVGETNTVTVAQADIVGTVVSAVTSVDTIVT